MLGPILPVSPGQQVAQLVGAGQTPAELAKECAPWAQMIRNWFARSGYSQLRKGIHIACKEKP